MAEALRLPPETAEAWVLDDTVLDAVIGFLASTPCMLFCLNQEDLTKSEEQLNLPGTTHEHPNWRRKMKYSVEELDSNPDAQHVTRMFRRWLENTGRVPPLA
jgi:4-alpha-glucanotransferase